MAEVPSWEEVREVSDEMLRQLYSAETADFREPAEPEAGDLVTVRLRVERPLEVTATLVLDAQLRLGMRPGRTTRAFTWYEASFRCPTEAFTYNIVVDVGGRSAVVHRFGALWDKATGPGPCPDASSEGGYDGRYDFRVYPGFHVPDWSVGALQYQILCDRFRNGDETNDVVEGEFEYYGVPVAGTLGWDEPIPEDDYRSFRGGDLAGIIEKLDYLQSLGVEVLYLTPIFVSPSSHKYDTQLYRAVDPHLGRIVTDAETDAGPCGERYRVRTTDPDNLKSSNELFARLCEELHARSMRVIVDGVFNHCGDFSPWLDAAGVYGARDGEGALWSKQSPYRSYFVITGTGVDASYESWCGFTSLPKLNFEESPRLREEVLDIVRMWASPPFSVDGWRLDAAAELGHSEVFNHAFWRRFRAVVKGANPDALIVSEHYGRTRQWLDGTQWDTLMNYDGFMVPLTKFLTGLDGRCDERFDELYQDGEAFFEAMERASAELSWPSLTCAMNELSNHDHARFLTRTKRTVGRLHTMGAEAASLGVDKAVLKEAVAVQMTWVGAPTIYYGDEAGLAGWTDPDCRRCFPWDAMDDDLVGYHRALAEVRRAHPALRSGALVRLGCGHGWIAFARIIGEDRVCTFVNNTDGPLAVTCRMRACGIEDGAELFALVVGRRDDYARDAGPICRVLHGMARIVLGPRSSVVATEVR